MGIVSQFGLGVAEEVAEVRAVVAQRVRREVLLGDEISLVGIEKLDGMRVEVWSCRRLGHGMYNAAAPRRVSD